MIATLPSLIRHTQQLWTKISWILLGIALVALAYLITRIMIALVDGRLFVEAARTSVWMLALSSAVYLLGHGFRILRLALLIGNWRIGFRDVASYHFMTAAVSLTAPLKLGELYSVIELSNLTGGMVNAITVTWMQRALDASLLLFVIILFISNYKMAGIEAYGAIAALVTLFLLVTVVILRVIPDNLRRLSVLIVRRYKTPATVPVLRAVETLRRAILKAPSLTQGKMASLATLTALIWMCELGSFVLGAPAIERNLGMGGQAMLEFLSAVIRGQTLFSAFGAGDNFTSGASASHLVLTQVPLALVGGVAAIHYLRFRLKL